VSDFITRSAGGGVTHCARPAGLSSVAERHITMLKSPARLCFLVAIVLLIVGAVFLPLFPQPFITYYCSASVCPRQIAGGIAIGYVLLALGIFAAVIGIMVSLIVRARQAHLSS
jgi:hypothetical protein